MPQSLPGTEDRIRLSTADADMSFNDANRPPALRPLLAKYRHLSLARAPVLDRLAALREIAAADPATPSWQRDVEELEKARLSELRNEAVACIRAEDAERIDGLLDEISSGNWRSPPPAELRETLSQASIAVHRHGAVDALRALVPRVRAALASGSDEEARAVFAQWGKVVKKSQLRVPPELLEEITPLARWIDEQDDRRHRDRAFGDACAALTDALGAGAGLDEIKLLHRQLLGFENEIPEELSIAYRRRMETLRLEAQTDRRRQFALAAALVLAVAAALGALAWAIVAAAHR